MKRTAKAPAKASPLEAIGGARLGRRPSFEKDFHTSAPSAFARISRQIGDLGVVAGKRGNGELPVPLVFNRALAQAVEDDAGYLCHCRSLVCHKAVDVLLIERAIKACARCRGTSPPCWSTKKGWKP